MVAVKERVETIELKSQRQINEKRQKEREEHIARVKENVERIRKGRKVQ
jgi:hypothetical protein